MDRTWEVTKGSVPVLVILSAVLCLFPWLAPAAGLAGFVGGSWMTVRIVRAALRALPQEQRDVLEAKAQAVGVEIPGISAEGGAV